jgi:hypothetical protein
MGAEDGAGAEEINIYKSTFNQVKNTTERARRGVPRDREPG